MLREFREFINRGNVIDLAVAVIMGAAFSAIVNSLVNDIVMPFIGVIMAASTFPIWPLPSARRRLPTASSFRRS